MNPQLLSWLPIEEAPKNEKILVWDEGYVIVRWYDARRPWADNEDISGWYEGDPNDPYQHYYQYDPTHFCYLNQPERQKRKRK
jgi:hypothetical protein